MLDPDGLPLPLLREADGARGPIAVALPGGRAAARARLARRRSAGCRCCCSTPTSRRTSASERDVTDRLYGGGGEHRLQQEMLLGIGGVRALRAYSPHHRRARARGVPHQRGPRRLPRPRADPRARSQAAELTFDEALEAVRAGTVFTTHTPVPAGIDRFPRDADRAVLRRRRRRARASPSSGSSRSAPRTTQGGDPRVFNMAVMGLRLAQRANGVSQLHGEVSRGMFDGLWPGFDDAEVPIGSITNGVHAPDLGGPRDPRRSARTSCGADLPSDGRALARRVDRRPGRARSGRSSATLRERLVEDVRARLRAVVAGSAAPADAELGWIDDVLDPDVLTIGFARRVPTYKRLTLMLRDPERLKRLLLDPERPIQLVIAGKSHPADDGGKQLIQQIVRFADDPEVRHRIVFLPDYDIAMARPLYPGCDVWLNNPLRPLEACGTSGMKAALNGGAQPLDPRRLVGRVVRRRERLGDPDRRRRRRRRPARRPRGGRALRPDRERRSRRASTTATSDGLPDALDRDGAAHPGDARPEGAGRAGWCATTSSSSTRRPPWRPAPSTAPLGTPKARELAAWKARVRAAWPGVRVDHVESSGLSATPRGRRAAARAGLRRARRAHPRRRRGAGRARPGRRRRPDRRTRRRRRSTCRDATRRAATASTATVALRPPARSATPCASLPKHHAAGRPGRAGPGGAAVRRRGDRLSVWSDRDPARRRRSAAVRVASRGRPRLSAR